MAWLTPPSHPWLPERFASTTSHLTATPAHAPRLRRPVPLRPSAVALSAGDHRGTSVPPVCRLPQDPNAKSPQDDRAMNPCVTSAVGKRRTERRTEQNDTPCGAKQARVSSRFSLDTQTEGAVAAAALRAELSGWRDGWRKGQTERKAAAGGMHSGTLGDCTPHSSRSRADPHTAELCHAKMIAQRHFDSSLECSESPCYTIAIDKHARSSALVASEQRLLGCSFAIFHHTPSPGVGRLGGCRGPFFFFACADASLTLSVLGTVEKVPAPTSGVLCKC